MSKRLKRYFNDFRPYLEFCKDNLQEDIADALRWGVEHLDRDDLIQQYLNILKRYLIQKTITEENKSHSPLESDSIFGKSAKENPKYPKRFLKLINGFQADRILEDYKTATSTNFTDGLLHFKSMCEVYKPNLWKEFRMHRKTSDGKLEPLEMQICIDSLQILTEKIEAISYQKEYKGDLDGMEWLKTSDNWAWFLIDSSHSRSEALAMNHCGNSDGSKTDRILSLREKIQDEDETSFWKPHATFILTAGGNLGEMKGFGNHKPSPKLHPHILELLQQTDIKGIQAGGYLQPNNFCLSDLSDDDFAFIREQRPDLVKNQYYWQKTSSEYGSHILAWREHRIFRDFVTFSVTTHHHKFFLCRKVAKQELVYHKPVLSAQLNDRNLTKITWEGFEDFEHITVKELAKFFEVIPAKFISGYNFIHDLRLSTLPDGWFDNVIPIIANKYHISHYDITGKSINLTITSTWQCPSTNQIWAMVGLPNQSAHLYAFSSYQKGSYIVTQPEAEVFIRSGELKSVTIHKKSLRADPDASFNILKKALYHPGVHSVSVPDDSTGEDFLKKLTAPFIRNLFEHKDHNALNVGELRILGTRIQSKKYTSFQTGSKTSELWFMRKDGNNTFLELLESDHSDGFDWMRPVISGLYSSQTLTDIKIADTDSRDLFASRKNALIDLLSSRAIRQILIDPHSNNFISLSDFTDEELLAMVTKNPEILRTNLDWISHDIIYDPSLIKLAKLRLDGNIPISVPNDHYPIAFYKDILDLATRFKHEITSFIIQENEAGIAAYKATFSHYRDAFTTNKLHTSFFSVIANKAGVTQTYREVHIERITIRKKWGVLISMKANTLSKILKEQFPHKEKFSILDINRILKVPDDIPDIKADPIVKKALKKRKSKNWTTESKTGKITDKAIRFLKWKNEL
jgi:hypothetical protein